MVSVVSLEETPETPTYIFRSGTFSTKIPHFDRRFLSTDSTLDHLLAFTIRFIKKSAQCTISRMVLVMNSLQTVSFTSALQRLTELLIPKLFFILLVLPIVLFSTSVTLPFHTSQVLSTFPHVIIYK